MGSDIHPNHAANLTAKAYRLAVVIHQTGLGNPETVAQLTDEHWGRIAVLAGENRIPSLPTRAAVVRLLHEEL